MMSPLMKTHPPSPLAPPAGMRWPSLQTHLFSTQNPHPHPTAMDGGVARVLQAKTSGLGSTSAPALPLLRSDTTRNKRLIIPERSVNGGSKIMKARRGRSVQKIAATTPHWRVRLRDEFEARSTARRDMYGEELQPMSLFGHSQQDVNFEQSNAHGSHLQLSQIQGFQEMALEEPFANVSEGYDKMAMKPEYTGKSDSARSEGSDSGYGYRSEDDLIKDINHPHTSLNSVHPSHFSPISHSTHLLFCPTCKKEVKTQSELKKHDLRHRKPFLCRVLTCPRYTAGFSTKNDLERHTMSKHPELSKKVDLWKKYRCLVPGCKSKEKAWPRLDNFRSHLKRVHGNQMGTDDDYDDMIRWGEFWSDSNKSLPSGLPSDRGYPGNLIGIDFYCGSHPEGINGSTPLLPASNSPFIKNDPWPTAPPTPRRSPPRDTLPQQPQSAQQQEPLPSPQTYRYDRQPPVAQAGTSSIVNQLSASSGKGCKMFIKPTISQDMTIDRARDLLCAVGDRQLRLLTR